MKLSLEDKLKIVKLYEEKGLGYLAIAKQLNLGTTTIKTIIKPCKEQGVLSLKHPPKQ